MDIEKLEKANELKYKIDSLNTDLKELEKGCGIEVTKDGKVYIKTEREWSSKTAPDWFAQKINEALYEYRSTLTATRDNLAIQLQEL